ncbi:casein kinase substrate phosphoprotein PP28-domain-containing protein [Podospora didyma]|uniref:Casein kinase substrate phosphoprotein PP28-domain-containing protein n=1 Tax=Podospora didyma TaxID=330526 RepID=A0AAE0NP37_9PEZI|nr:casein kinase substrate phosphoprotein PP28-domain-containing protein [Podospora didyma]
MAGGSGAPGGNSRGRGGKFRKFTRGGGKHFSRDLAPLDSNGNEIRMKKDDDDDESSEEDSEEESSEEESEDDAGPSKKPAAELNREERKAEKKARKEAAAARARGQTVQVGDMPSSDEDEDSDDEDEAMPANPNHSKASRNQTKPPPKASVDEVTEGVKKVTVSAGTPSRREREAIEAEKAKERYMKLHEAGKTDEAKADLARLALIRQKRAEEAARKQAEKEEREEQEKIKKAMTESQAKKRLEAMGPGKKLNRKK